MGATTAIFSVLYGVVLRPLPFHDPGALVQLNARAEDGRLLGLSQVELEDWVAQASAFESVALYGFYQFTLTGTAEPEMLRGAIVSPQFFSLLSVPMRIGRGLSDEDDLVPHAVIAESLWQGRFGGDPAIVGRAVMLNGQPYTVVGVAPRRLRFPADDVALWTGLGYARTAAPPQWTMRGFRQFSIVARLRDAAAIADARREVDAIAASLASAYPRFNGRIGAVITPLKERLTGEVRPALLVLFAAVTLVLLVACGNIANLSFARAAARQRDMAIRSAAGASQGQLVAHALAESTVLAATGALLSLGIAEGSLAAIMRFIPPDAPRAAEIHIDAMSAVFTSAIALLSVLVFGVWPAVWAARRPASDALRQVRHSPGGLAIFRDGLIVSEISLAVVLLVGSTLLGRSLYNLMATGTGAGNGDAVTMKLNLSPDPTGSASRQAALADRVLMELRMTPGVQAAGLASSLPPNVSQMRTSLAAIDAAGAPQEVAVEIVAAGGDVFPALGVPVVAGRSFSDTDTAESGQVVILSKQAADRFFPQGDAVGRGLQAFATDRGKPAPTVVGVVGDVKFAGLDAPPDGAIYVPHTQRSFRTQYLVVRANDGPASVAAIRAALRRIDPSLAVSEVRSLGDLVTAATARPRFQASLLILFAVLALALATVGLYGVITHVVGQRAQELAVRMALGATRADVLGMILRKALLLTVVGATIGLGVSYGSARAIESFLYGVSALDWPSFALSALFAVGVGVAAAMGPAIRATRVNPAESLRAG